MSLVWSRTEGANGPSLSIVFSDGEIATVGKEHASLKELTKLVASDAPEEEIRALLNPVKSIITRFQRLSDRVTTDGVNLFFDGDAIHDTLAEYILNLLRLEAEGTSEVSWRPFVHFLEKLAQNPSQDSRESLYDFVNKWGLTIRENGDFIAYKGILDDFTSKQSGPGIVNNVKLNGHLPNKPGDLVEIERSYVNANRDQACAQGLHAGTHEYASWWGERVVAVAINPRDVVAVPRGEVSKLRISRYEVLVEVKKETRPVATAGEKSAPLWSSTQELDKKLLKKLKKAVKNGQNIEVEYRGKSYSVTPRRIEDDLLKVRLAEKPKDYRQFTLNKITSVKVIDSSKKSKKPAKKFTGESVGSRVEKAIKNSELVEFTLANKSKVIAKPRRLEEAYVGVTVPANGNRFQKIFLSEVTGVKKA